MTKYKYITTTLPYANASCHIGGCFEFVLADVLAEYFRLKGNEVVFNVGIDEHGQKVYQKAIDDGFSNTQEYCDAMAENWKRFCARLNINYTNFYRTTDPKHKENVLRFYNEIKQHIFSKEYEGKYCVGCESFITEKEIVNGQCPTHNTALISTKEINKFFDLSKFSDSIQDVLVDKSKSAELANILQDKFDLSITRQNVKWGIETGEGDVFYVWAEALLNYLFAVKYYEDKEYFDNYWSNSLIICGKDNLKFQAYILQALLLANNIPQTKEVLVHGIILDANGRKMSKSEGNVIDPIEQVEKYGLDAVRYYLIFGLNTLGDSKYSEEDLVKLWNDEVVNGFGNLVSRLLHLIDIKQVVLDENNLSVECKERIISNSKKIDENFEKYDFNYVGSLLSVIVSYLNRRITQEKPFDKDCPNPSEILNEVYFELKNILKYYTIILKESADSINAAFEINKKTILFSRK